MKMQNNEEKLIVFDDMDLQDVQIAVNHFSKLFEARIKKWFHLEYTL